MNDLELSKRLDNLLRRHIDLQLRLVEQTVLLNSLSATFLKVFPPGTEIILGQYQKIEREKAKEAVEVLQAQLKALDLHGPSTHLVQ